MKMHFIGLGERIMGDLAINLSQQGHQITGSDIFFSKSSSDSLASKMLMPDQAGWFPKKIQPHLDKIVVGREVQLDNPELQVAQQLGLSLCSYPEYVHDYAQDKQRIVIVGGEEKKLLCLLVLHVLGHLQQSFDYVVDSPALKASVQLSNAPIIILEGDMAPSSPIDSKPQSLRYEHNIALINGIDGKLGNTQRILETYLKQVANLANSSPKGGTLIYLEEDNLTQAIGSQVRSDVKVVPYQTHPHRYEGQQAYLITSQKDILLRDKAFIMSAVTGARELLRNLAIQDQQFYEALTTFIESGAE